VLLDTQIAIAAGHRPARIPKRVGAENPVTLCDLQVFVYEAAESISSS
jgi:hypothetical protein